MPDSGQPSSIQQTSQFSLRALLMVPFCLAVGLIIGTLPLMEFEDGLDFLTSLPGILHEILLAAGSAAVCIGLVQQALLLRRTIAVDGLTDNKKSMLRLAIAWRIAIASVLALCLLFEMLIARGHVTLPAEYDGFKSMFYGPVFPQYIRYACLLVVLGEYRNRLSSVINNVPPRLWMFAASWAAAAMLVILILPSQLAVQYLVYIAIAGIEAAQPARFQRPGAYPHHQAEGF